MWWLLLYFAIIYFLYITSSKVSLPSGRDVKQRYNVIDFNVGKTTRVQRCFDVRFQRWNNVRFQRWNNVRVQRWNVIFQRCFNVIFQRLISTLIRFNNIECLFNIEVRLCFNVVSTFICLMGSVIPSAWHTYIINWCVCLLSIYSVFCALHHRWFFIALSMQSFQMAAISV